MKAQLILIPDYAPIWIVPTLEAREQIYDAYRASMTSDVDVRSVVLVLVFSAGVEVVIADPKIGPPSTQGGHVVPEVLIPWIEDRLRGDA